MRDLAPAVYIVDDDNGVRTPVKVLVKSIGLAAITYASAKEFLTA